MIGSIEIIIIISFSIIGSFTDISLTNIAIKRQLSTTIISATIIILELGGGSNV